MSKKQQPLIPQLEVIKVFFVETPCFLCQTEREGNKGFCWLQLNVYLTKRILKFDATVDIRPILSYNHNWTYDRVQPVSTRVVYLVEKDFTQRCWP